jgi:hypothetical protein
MAIPNVNQITTDLRMMGDQQLQQYAAMHKNDPYILPMAIAESNSRKALRAAKQAQDGGQPQQKVADQALASMGTPPPQMAQQQLPEQQGIGALPVQNMQHMADGGIAGYADGGEFNYAGSSDGPLMNMAGGGEPVVRMAEGGIAHFADTGLVRLPNESFADFRRRNFEAELQAQQDKNLAETTAREAERQKYLAARGETNVVPPSPFFDRAPLSAPSGSAAPAPASAAPASAPAIPVAAATPAATDNKQLPPPAPPTARSASASTPAAPAAPETSAAERFRSMQKEMGAGDRTAIDDKQKLLEKSMLSGATEEQTNLEKEIAARGEYGKAKEERLAAREAGLGKEKDTLLGLAALETALGLISTPGPFMNALGSSAQKGLKTYGEGIAKLKLAKEKIDDSRDQIDEFRRNESNMTAKERRDAANNINRTKTAIEQLGVAGLEKTYGYKTDEAKAVFSAATQEGLTKQEIASKEKIASMQERGANARAALPSGEMRTAMMLGTGATDAAKLESGMKKLQEITADKSGMAAVKLLAETNAGRAKNGEPPITMQDLLGSAREYSALMYPKVADIPKTNMLTR